MTNMTCMTWTLDAEGRLKVVWIMPPLKAAAPSARRHSFHTMTQAATTPAPFSRAAALAAYYRIQTSVARHWAA